MPVDMAVFLKNRTAIPPDELERFAGQWIVWAPDGTHILAGSRVSEEALWEQLKAQGLNPFDYVWGYIDEDGTI